MPSEAMTAFPSSWYRQSAIAMPHYQCVLHRPAQGVPGGFEDLRIRTVRQGLSTRRGSSPWQVWTPLRVHSSWEVQKAIGSGHPVDPTRAALARPRCAAVMTIRASSLSSALRP